MFWSDTTTSHPPNNGNQRKCSRNGEFRGLGIGWNHPKSGNRRGRQKYWNEERSRKAFATGNLHLDDVFWVIIKLIDLVSKIAGSVAVLFLLYGGIQLMISGISDDKESAKNTIKYALMGLVVTFMAWLIVKLVETQMLGA
ncbi:hypothetical protein HC823_01815 [Candidatus Gracilibacteria bacterium]|nr:hypothetical protein [Candidatus Gracilibacteria bacterium]